MKPCLTPGCPNLAPRGTSHCPDHREQRTSFEERYGINRARWHRLTKRVKRRDGYRCVKCGVRESDTNRLEVDHVVPRGLGGTNAMMNLQTLCHPCHTAKTTADRKAMRDA